MTLPHDDELALAERLGEVRSEIMTELRKRIIGQEAVIELVLLSLFVGGNSLIVGVPGLAKTLLIHTIARVLDLKFSRIQFTPDLMPSDITGTDIIQEDPETGRRRLAFVPGPIFANIVLADEINRTPPKTQAALLEAMQEHRVTVQGKTYELEEPFFVLATQNPIELEGTYPLPEAQLDRFLFKLLVGYASPEAERDIVLLHHRGFAMDNLAAAGITPLLDEAGVLDLRRQIDAVALDGSVIDYLVAIERATRTAPEAQYGASVRGAIGLMRAAKALAAFAGREYVTPDDVKSVAPPVLRHRLLLRPEAELDGVTPDDVITRILGNVPVPR